MDGGQVSPDAGLERLILPQGSLGSAILLQVTQDELIGIRVGGVGRQEMQL